MKCCFYSLSIITHYVSSRKIMLQITNPKTDVQQKEQQRSVSRAQGDIQVSRQVEEKTGALIKGKRSSQEVKQALQEPEGHKST